MSADLRTALAERLDTVEAPRGDLQAAVRVGTRRRRVRRGAVAAGTAGALAMVAVVVTGQLRDTVADHTVVDHPSLGQLDFSGGLRAYADPGHEVHLGGRTFDASNLEWLDTDAAATPWGIVFYDAGRPMLLGEDGETVSLVDGPVESRQGFHPTAKVDSIQPQVAYATLRDGGATITVRDMESGKDVGSLDVECGGCGDLVIDGIDDGVVFFRDGNGTQAWSVGDPDPVEFAPDAQVVDVRNHVLLYDGQEPSSELADRYLLVRAPVDAQLTYDGDFVLYWSSRLEPTHEGEAPMVLEQGPTKRFALGFWTIDTDGSVLVAAPSGEYPDYTVNDCEVPSGACTEVGPLSPEGGDPMFIGNDM